jgi:hypothetical protein
VPIASVTAIDHMTRCRARVLIIRIVYTST